MDWAQKRKITYALFFVGAIVLIAAYPVYSLVSKPASCFDAKKNGSETGVDCGGSCNLMCVVDMKAPRAVWAKAFPVNGNYDLGVFVENMNTTAGIKNARYTIRALGSAGEVLVERTGTTEFVPSGRVLLFETGVVLASHPSSVEVLFNNNDLTRWMKATAAPSTVVTKNQSLKNADTKPRFDAVLVNTDQINDVTSLTLGAIIYDSQKRPVAVSKTYVDRIGKGGEQSIFFTWPDRFTLKARGEKCIAPVSTMFVVDRSKSMDVGGKVPVEPLESVKNAMKTYLSVVSANDKIGLVTFDGTASSSVNIELSSDVLTFSDKLSEISLSKSTLLNTDLGSALEAALVQLKSASGASEKKAIITFTDGFPLRPIDPLNAKNKEYAEIYASDIATQARKDGVIVSAFGVGKKVNGTFLRDGIAGGASHYFSTSTPEILQNLYDSISETACPQENFITELVVTPRAIFAE